MKSCFDMRIWGDQFGGGGEHSSLVNVVTRKYYISENQTFQGSRFFEFILKTMKTIGAYVVSLPVEPSPGTTV